jgi:hypothetical protein
MNHSKLIDIYYKIPQIYSPKIVKRVYNKILEKIFNILANHYLPIYYIKNPCPGLLNKKNDIISNKIIASLTSFPSRINITHLSIESIFRQTIRPDRIILWLAVEQFPNYEKDLPNELIKLKNKGLEIRYCEDIRSHKKYFYSLKEFKNEFVVIFDDDLFFHRDIIKNLILIHNKYPNCVVGTRVHKMKFTNGVLVNYRDWEINILGEEASVLHHSNSGHGTLIPPTVKFDDIFFNKELFMRLTPNSDDVWFKVNLIRLGIPVVTNASHSRDTLSIKGTYKSSLVSNNTHKGMKDIQFKAVFKHFGIETTEKVLESFDQKSITN